MVHVNILFAGAENQLLLQADVIWGNMAGVIAALLLCMSDEDACLACSAQKLRQLKRSRVEHISSGDHARDEALLC
jgi:hypothetical protein